MIRLWLWIITLTFSSSQADIVVDTTIRLFRKQGFKITYQEGQPIRIVMPDGREISSFKRTMKPQRIQVPLEFSENLCLPAAPKPSCRYTLDAKVESVDMRWTKHRDKKRIGQIIKHSGEMTGTRSILWTSPLKYLAPSSTADLKEDELICDRWDWIPGGTKDRPPKNLKMSSLAGDYNTENYFIDAAVNQGLTGYYNLEWTRTENNSLKLTKTGPVFSQARFYAPPFVGFMVSFIIENPKGLSHLEKFCQIAVRPDSTYYTGTWGSALKDSEPSLYTLGSDDLYYHLQLFYDFTGEIFSLETIL